ncbi:MAG TPA: hypothetical protein VGF96_19225 [Terracidiphilus sp.]|jgi:hypothetical protein
MATVKKPSKDEAKELSMEMAALSRQQYEALQKSSYIRMSKEEADAYNERRLRIGEICDLLAEFRLKGQ